MKVREKNDKQDGKRFLQVSDTIPKLHLSTAIQKHQVWRRPHLFSSCFTVPDIWFIFSSRRAMTSLFCLELASAL